MSYADFQNINDFSLIDTAVQKFFIAASGAFVAPPDDTDNARSSWTPDAGMVGFYTPLQAATFQMARPRVYIASLKFQRVQGAYAIDGDGVIREKAWTGTMNLGIDTAANWTVHKDLRSLVMSIIPQAVVISADGALFASGGLNALLQYHQVSQFSPATYSTSIIPGEGIYSSSLPITIAFSVLPSAWPAGMQTM